MSVWVCQECVDGSWGVHRCTAPEDCECRSQECLPPVWVGTPRWRVAGERDEDVAHHKLCSCDGPPHQWSPGWCPDKPVMRRRS